jgi:hypothetical protein
LSLYCIDANLSLALMCVSVARAHVRLCSGLITGLGRRIGVGKESGARWLLPFACCVG